MFRHLIVASLFFLSTIAPAHAVSITYSAANESGSTWRYSYTLSNDSLAGGVSEFRISFALGDFAGLQVAASPDGWDPIAADPDPGLPDDGYVDWLAPLAGPLALGDSLAGFQVLFTWLGAGTPGSQPFSVLDPETFETLFEGRTALADTEPPTGVPEPGTLALLGIGLVGLVFARRRR